MRDIGALPTIALEATLPLAVVCRDGSDVSTEPTGTPTYAVYGPGSDTALSGGTGNVAGTPGSTAGIRSADIVCSAANGFAADTAYFVVVEYVVTAVTYHAVAHFQIQ